MNRKNAIIRLFLLTGSFVVPYAGIKLYKISKVPDLKNIKERWELIDALAETIIPATDSPGASEAAVGEFIMLMLKECTDRRSQNNFINGIISLEEYTHDNFEKPFIQCSLKERVAVLQHIEDSEKLFGGTLGEIEHKVLGSPFLETLKKYTIMGYCTSQAGVTKGLRYDYIPGKYVGTVPLSPNEKAWATF